MAQIAVAENTDENTAENTAEDTAEDTAEGTAENTADADSAVFDERGPVEFGGCAAAEGVDCTAAAAAAAAVHFQCPTD